MNDELQEAREILRVALHIPLGITESGAMGPAGGHTAVTLAKQAVLKLDTCERRLEEYRSLLSQSDQEVRLKLNEYRMECCRLREMLQKLLFYCKDDQNSKDARASFANILQISEDLLP